MIQRESRKISGNSDRSRISEEGERQLETYHIIGNDGSMSVIDLDSVNSKDSCHLIDDCRSTSFDTVCLEDGVDVGSVELVEVDQFIGKRPHALNVTSLRHQFTLIESAITSLATM